MVQPCRLDVHFLRRLMGNGVELRPDVRVGVATDGAGRHVDAQHVGQHIAHHAVAGENLMAESHHPDLAVASDGVADAHHGIGEVDEPGVRAGLLHGVGDLQHRQHVADGVGKAAGTAVLCIGLAHAIFERQLVVAAPQHLTRGHLDGRDDKAGAVEGILVVGVGGEAHLGAPLPVHPFGQPLDQRQRLGIAVHQRHVAAAQRWVAHESGHGVEAKAGAARADNNDFGWQHKQFLLMYG